MSNVNANVNVKITNKMPKFALFHHNGSYELLKPLNCGSTEHSPAYMEQMEKPKSGLRLGLLTPPLTQLKLCTPL